MNDTAFGAVASQLDDAALLRTIRRRVAAAGTSFYWAMRLLPQHRHYAHVFEEAGPIRAPPVRRGRTSLGPARLVEGAPQRKQAREVGS